MDSSDQTEPNQMPADDDLLVAVKEAIGDAYEVVQDLGDGGGHTHLYLVRERASGREQTLRLKFDPNAPPGQNAYVLQATQVMPAAKPNPAADPSLTDLLLTPLPAGQPPAIDHEEKMETMLTPTVPAEVKRVCPECGTTYESTLLYCPKDGASLQVTRETGGLVGRVIAGRFRIVRRIGGGGMGDVYLADQVAIGRRVAFKVLHRSLTSDADGVRRFHREARNASQISHQHVATVYDYGESEDGLIYLAMEFIDGETLAQALEREKTFTPEKTADLIRQIAEALTAAHSQEPPLVHCDLKPDNVMLARQANGDETVKVVDFGIAKAPGGDNQRVTRTGLVAGTPAYMSPEQLMAEDPTPRSDVYSLGLMAFEMLTGKRPFTDDGSPASAFQRLSTPPRKLAEVKPDGRWPLSLQAVFDKVLASTPEDRYPSARAFSQGLTAVLTQPMKAPTPVTPPITRIPSSPSIPQRSNRTPIFAGVVAAIVIVLVGGVYALISHSHQLAPVTPAATDTTTHPVTTPNFPPVTETLHVTGSPIVAIPPVTVVHHTAPVTKPAHVDYTSALDHLASLTDANTATPATAQRAVAEVDTLLPHLTTVSDSVEAQYHEAEAYLLMDQPTKACALLTHLAPRSAHTKFSSAINNLLTNGCS